MPALAPNPRASLNPGYTPPPIGPSADAGMPYGSPNTFSAAVKTQASDYDKIMAQYDDLINSSKSATNINNKPLNYTPIAPQRTQYQQSGDVSSAMGNLSSLASNGGYTDQGIADIRARDISPIRSIYASAQANLDRNRVLQGGYSPNYAAASAKMAREASEQIGQITTNANAGIAERQAAGRLSIAPSFASFAGTQNAARNANESENAASVNRANEVNASNELAYSNANKATGNVTNSNILEGLAGKKSLYGTTPALAATFGQQVAQAGQLGQNQQTINNNQRRDMWGRIIPALG